jgi:hypothetical protein
VRLPANLRSLSARRQVPLVAQSDSAPPATRRLREIWWSPLYASRNAGALRHPLSSPSPHRFGIDFDPSVVWTGADPISRAGRASRTRGRGSYPLPFLAGAHAAGRCGSPRPLWPAESSAQITGEPASSRARGSAKRSACRRARRATARDRTRSGARAEMACSATYRSAATPAVLSVERNDRRIERRRIQPGAYRLAPGARPASSGLWRRLHAKAAAETWWVGACNFAGPALDAGNKARHRGIS